MSLSENTADIQGDSASPGVVRTDTQDAAAVDFPANVLKQLEDQVLCRNRWVVPVLPGGELEVLMHAAIKLAKEGRDEDNELCRRFYKDAMAQSYYKILVDEASSQWRHEIHVAIYNSCKLLMELLALKIQSDTISLLQLLQFALNPAVRFHVHNASEKSNTCQQPNDVLLFAKTSSEGRPPKGWVIDFINWFGEFGGFDRLLQRFSAVSAAISAAKERQQQGASHGPVQSRHNSGGSDRQSPGVPVVVGSPPSSSTSEHSAPHHDQLLRPSSATRQTSSPALGELLSIQLISALLKPFSSCHEFLLPSTIQNYFVPIRDHLFEFFDSLSDQQIQKFSSTTPRSDGRIGESLGSILRYLRLLLLELPESETVVAGLEDLRLRLIMRQLHSQTFSTKMAGLAELNRLASSQESDDYPAVERLTTWLSAGKLLPLLLKDFLHLPQYIDRVEKLLRFMIRHKAIGAAELDLIWSVQTDQHEAIVKNVHDLLARLAWDFSVEQLDHFFGLIAKAWPSASRRQQEQLLLLLKRLAEEDRDGQTATKVLQSLWTMVREPAVSVLVLEQALACHAAVLEGCLMSRRDEVRWHWLVHFIEDIRREPISLALPELRQILAIIETWPQSSDMQRRMTATMAAESSRVEVIHRLRERYSIFDLLIDNLAEYMKFVRANFGTQLIPETMPDNRYDHVTQVKERLRLIRFLLQEGDVWLSDMHATKVWQTLAVGWVHTVDRDICFKWFSKLVANGPDMDPSTIGPFFTNQLLQLDPCLMTENGVACFRAFFHHANKEQPHHAAQPQTANHSAARENDEPLIGIDYLWRMVLQADDPAADSAAVLLRETLSEIALPVNMGCGDSGTMGSVEMVAENFVERFRVAADSARPLIIEAESDRQRRVAVSRLLRVLTLIRAVVANTDAAFTGIRVNHPPLWRLCIGKQLRIRLRFSSGQATATSATDEIVYETNAHEQVACLRQWAATKLSVHDVQLLRPGSSPLIQQDYARVFDEAGITDGSLLIARVIPVSASAGTNMGLELNDADSSDAECAGAGGADSGNEGGAVNGGVDNAVLNSGTAAVPHSSHVSQFLLDESCLLSVQLARSPVFISMLLDVADWAPGQIRSATLLLLNHLPANPDALTRITSSPDLGEFFLNYSKTPVALFYYFKLMAALLCPVRGTPDSFFMERFIRTAVPALHRIILADMRWPADILTQALSLLNITAGLLAVAGLMSLQRHAGYTILQQQQPGLFVDHDRQLQAILSVCPPLCFSSATSWGEFLLQRFRYNLPLNLVDGTTDESQLADLAVAIRNMAWSTLFTAAPHIADFSRGVYNTNSPTFTLTVSDESTLFISEATRVIVCLVLLNPARAASLIRDRAYQTFIVDLLLVCPQATVRHAVAQGLFQLATNSECWHFLVSLLFTTLSTTTSPAYQERSFDFCELICRLLTMPNTPQFQAGYWQSLLTDRWKAIASMQSASSVFRDNQLAICAQLAALLTPTQRSYVATELAGPRVLHALLENFIFAPSLFLQQSGGSEPVPSKSTKNISSVTSFSASTVEVALSFAGRLCEDSLPNLEYASDMVLECMSADPEALPTSEWECAPAIGPRPVHGYVGLKNAGATCYMNSVLQQLFMLDPIRDAILSVSDSIVTIPQDVNDQNGVPASDGGNCASGSTTLVTATSGQAYNKLILSDLRLTFAFLLMADAQFYTPTELWRHLRLGGEAVNVREQHDALEFLHNLGDAVDEAMRGSLSTGVPPIIERTLGGTFADLKICRDCPHRYSREETFTTISVDVRNHRNLHESLDQYVRPDLLDGQNAYFCEQCQAKVTAIKRLCVRNLPPVLVIQLKRFDYDWERDCATKFNDYFEFPRQLDMEPYTETGVARRDVDNPHATANGGNQSSGTSTPTAGDPAIYNLIGVVVHSGQASGGHYYSFIRRRSDQKWFRFDDCDVTEASLDDDVELRNQCFGGETDPVVSAASVGSMSRGIRRHRNYWNAYLLFYERVSPSQENNSLQLANKVQRLSVSADSPRREPSPPPPPPIIAARLMQAVNEWNALVGHRRLHFSMAYFNFCKQILSACSHFQPVESPEASAAAACGLRLATRHVFDLALRVRRSIRGNAVDLTDLCAKLLQRSRSVDRRAFILASGLLNPGRIWEFVVDCQSVEVRSAVSRLLSSFVDYAMSDPPILDESAKQATIVNFVEKLPQHVQELVSHANSPGYLLVSVCLSLLRRRDLSDFIRHASALFLICCDVNTMARRKLAINLHVPNVLLQLILDDSFTSAARHHQSELAPLCTALSVLLRSMDFSSLCDASPSSPGVVEGKAPSVKANPYSEPMTFGVAPQNILELVGAVKQQQGFQFPRRLVNWLHSASEEITKLFQFLSWENWSFSGMAITMALQAMISVGVGDCALYASLVVSLVTIPDSWQVNRLEHLLHAGGSSTTSETLPSVVERLRQQQPRRAYLFLKVLVTLLTNIPIARHVLAGDAAASRAFVATVEWLRNQLADSAEVDPVPSVWTGPLSNESSGGYYLEHSQSARNILAQAVQLLPSINVTPSVGDGPAIASSSGVTAAATTTTTTTTTSTSGVSVPHSSSMSTPPTVPVVIDMLDPDDTPMSSLSPPVSNPLKRSPPIPVESVTGDNGSSSSDDDRPSSPKMGSDSGPHSPTMSN